MKFLSISIIATFYAFALVTAAPVMISFSNPHGNWPHPKQIAFDDPDAKWPESSRPQPEANPPQHPVAKQPSRFVPIAPRPSPMDFAQHHVPSRFVRIAPRPATMNFAQHSASNPPQHNYPTLSLGIEPGAVHPPRPDPEHGSTSNLKRKQTLNLLPDSSSKHPKTS